MKTKKESAAGQLKLSPLQEEIRRQKRLENIVSGIYLAIIVIAFLFSWIVGLVALIFGLWSWLWYEYGKYSICCDEYEVGGFPSMGVRTMIKSWFVFAALVALICYFIFT